jgi:hypothetical protein
VGANNFVAYTLIYFLEVPPCFLLPWLDFYQFLQVRETLIARRLETTVAWLARLGKSVDYSARQLPVTVTPLGLGLEYLYPMLADVSVPPSHDGAFGRVESACISPAAWQSSTAYVEARYAASLSKCHLDWARGLSSFAGASLAFRDSKPSMVDL